MDNNTNKSVQTTPSATPVLVFGILSLVIGSLLGAIFGFVARSKAKKYLAATGGVTNPQVKIGNILGLIGIILGFITFVGAMIYFALYGFSAILGILAAMGGTYGGEYYYSLLPMLLI